MLEVSDVIAHQVVERGGLALGNHPPPDLMKVVPGMLAKPHLVRDGDHQPSQVQVVMEPELNQLGPGSILITLNRHPVVLRVSREHQVVLGRRPDETLMIVGRRID
jgi:hypothetical protein